jgi:hypothetical protein
VDAFLQLLFQSASPKKPKTNVAMFAASQSEGFDQDSMILFRRHPSRAPKNYLVPRASIGYGKKGGHVNAVIHHKQFLAWQKESLAEISI